MVTAVLKRCTDDELRLQVTRETKMFGCRTPTVNFCIDVKNVKNNCENVEKR